MVAPKKQQTAAVATVESTATTKKVVTKAKKEKEVVTAPVVPQEPKVSKKEKVVEEPPHVEESATSEKPRVTTRDLHTLIGQLVEVDTNLRSKITSLYAQVKVLQDEYRKSKRLSDAIVKRSLEDKSRADKAREKKALRQKRPLHKNNGITQPVRYSNQLCDYLGIPHDHSNTRAKFTSMINARVKERNPDTKNIPEKDGDFLALLGYKTIDEVNADFKVDKKGNPIKKPSLVMFNSAVQRKHLSPLSSSQQETVVA